MAPFSASHIARRFLQVAACLLVAAVLVFLGLTRTQVGRSELADQLERQFDARFEGRLEIEELQGNLVQDLYASGVHLFDPQGRLVADIDSVVIEPRWRALLNRQISVDELTVYRPRLQLIRQPGGRWNLRSALRRTAHPDTADTPSPWHLSSADIEVIGGAITTRNAGRRPRVVAEGKVFDYTNTTLRDIQGHAHLEWQAEPPQLDLLDFSAALADPALRFDTIKGQLLFERGGLSVTHLAVQTPQSRINATGTLQALAQPSRTDSLSLHLRPSTIDFAEWQRLFPALPLSGTVQASAEVAGKPSRLHISSLSIERNATRLSAEGTLTGLPDSLDFFLTFSGEQVDVDDVRDVFPSAGLAAYRHLDGLTGSLTTRGVWHPRDSTTGSHLQATSTVNLQTPTGRLAGTVDLTKPESDPLQYQATLHGDTLDLGRLLNEPRLASRLNGQLRIAGTALDPTQAATEIELQLDRSTLGSVPLDNLHLNLRADSGRVFGTARLGPETGRLRTTLSANLAAAHPSYDVTMTGRRADLGPLLNLDSLSTALDGTLTLEAEGRTWAAARGRLVLNLDTSTVRYRSTTYQLPAHETRLTLAPDSSAQPRLQLDGDAAAASLQGDVGPELLTVARHWGRALQEAVRNELDKPYREPAEDEIPAPPSPHFPAGPLPALTTQLDLQVKRPELLHGLLPMLPRPPAGFRSSLHLQSTADSLQLTGTATADSLRRGSVRLISPTARLTLVSDSARALPASLQGSFELTGNRAFILGQAVQDPTLTVQQHGRHSAIRFASGSSKQGPLELRAGLDLLADRNRLTVHHLRVASDAYVWQNASNSHLDLYADAVTIPGLTLINRADSDTPHPQRMTLTGGLSNHASDTLHLYASDVALHELSQLANMNKPIGGLANGHLAVTGPLAAPSVAGHVDVSTLAFDNRILGNLTLRSSLAPHQSGIDLSASLYPITAENTPSEPLAALQPVSPAAPRAAGFADSLYLAGLPRPLQFEPNRLDLTGTVQLPDLASPGGGSGRLDLQLDVSRADAFFMEYIFDKVLSRSSGYLHGGGQITGSLFRPVFEVDMQLADGSFEIPRLGLTYTGSGPLRISRDGIVLDGLHLEDDTGGSASLDGTVRFNNYRYFSFDLAATLNDLQVVNTSEPHDLPFYGEIWGSGDFSLTGPLPNATIRSSNARMSAKSDVHIPIDKRKEATDAGFIIFADSTGNLPSLERLTRRDNILSDRPEGERKFLDGLDLDLNVHALPGTSVHLVIDPLLGDVINAVGSGRLQFQRQEGELNTYGTLNVSGGDYLFTAGELFFRRFLIKEGGTINWDGPTNNPRLDLTATYRTRASQAGLPEQLGAALPTSIPVIIQVDISRHLSSPHIELDLTVDYNKQEVVANYESLEAYLNQAGRTAEFATSVLLTNSFLLTTSLAEQRAPNELSNTRNRFAFSSISQLVGSQLNRYLNAAIPNLNVSFGLQGQNTEDLGVSYGVALRLLDERLVIRGEGTYQNEQSHRHPQGLEGAFVIEVRLNPQVSVEVFYRREGDLSATNLTNTTGAGLSYQTQFPTWDHLVDHLFGWALPDDKDAPEPKE